MLLSLIAGVEGAIKQPVRGDQGMIHIPTLIDCCVSDSIIFTPLTTQVHHSLCMWTDSRESTKIHLQHGFHYRIASTSNWQ